MSDSIERSAEVSFLTYQSGISFSVYDPPEMIEITDALKKTSMNNSFRFAL